MILVSVLLKRLLALFVILGLVFGLTTATASADNYPWPHNGCTHALDKPGGFDFTDPCNRHDGCYAGHWADRGTCDAWFRNDMLKVCRRANWQIASNCVIYAYTYYAFVRMFGQKYYDSNGVLVRINVNVA